MDGLIRAEYGCFLAVDIGVTTHRSLAGDDLPSTARRGLDRPVAGARRDDEPRARIRAAGGWLVPNRLVVEVLAFETDDPGMSGTMTMTTTLTPRESGTDVTISHHGLPDSVPTADNEAGTRMALANLAMLVEPG